MSYRVQLSPHATREYRKLDPPVKPMVQAGIDALRQNPVSGPRVKRLKGRLHRYHRYRAGEYRILYTVDQSSRTVYVDYIQHRKDIYRGAE